MKKKRQQSSTLPLLIIGLGAALILGAVAWYLIASNQPVDVQTLPSTAESGAAGIERVSLADAKAAFDLGQAVFVDVRGANYYADRHIPGALSIPLADLPQRLGELDPEDWIVTY